MLARALARDLALKLGLIVFKKDNQDLKSLSASFCKSFRLTLLADK